MPSEMDTDEVAELMSGVRDRHIDNIEVPTGFAFVIYFTHPRDRSRRFRFEANLESRNLWLHERTDDGNVQVWENKGGRV